MKCWIWRDRWHRSGNNGIRVQIWTLRVSQTWTYMYVMFLVFGALYLFDKYYSFFLFFFAFQPSQLGNCWYFGPFWTIYLLNSSRVMPAWINSVHAVVRAEWFVILPGKWARFVISRRIDQSVFSPKGFFFVPNGRKMETVVIDGN